MIASLVIGATMAFAVPTPPSGPSAVDRRSIQQIAERMDRAWTAGDADANASLFAADATARFGDDPLGAGRDSIRGQFHSFFQGRPSDLRHVTNIERIELLAPNLALWDAEVRVERQQAGGHWMALTIIRNVTIVVRQPDGWRIKAVRAFPVTR